MDRLSIIDSCHGCGVCCLGQESPPGYLLLMFSDESQLPAEAEEDANRLKKLPAMAKYELLVYANRLRKQEIRAGQACIWFNAASGECRYHEHRPSTCRDFERGGEDCLYLRQVYGIE